LKQEEQEEDKRLQKIPEEQLTGLYMKVYEKIEQITNEIMPNYNLTRERIITKVIYDKPKKK